MDNKFDIIFSQKIKMEQYADELHEIHLRLVDYKDELSKAWAADGAETVGEAVDRLDRQNRRIIEELCQIGQDMLKAYAELEEEKQNLGEV